MMRWIVGASLNYRLLVAALAVALMVAGVVQLRNRPVDTLPEFAPVHVEVQTEALGLSAAEVEQLITVPLEQNLLNGVAWLDEIRSESVTGLSRIVLIFQPGTDPLRARQVVQERLTQWRDLPKVSKPPVMIQPLSSTSRVMMIWLSSDQLTPIELSVLARWTIKPDLMGVPGVANVAIFGQRERQLQVQVDPERLRAAGVSLDQILETTGNALWVSPLSFLEASTPGSGGFIDTPNQRLGIQHVLPIDTPAELAMVPLEGCTGGVTTATRHVDANCPAPPEPRPLTTIGDVATVVEDHQPLIGDALSGDTPGVLLVVEKFPETNTLAVTQDVEAALAGMAPGLPGVQIDTSVYRPANYIESAIDNLGLAFFVGALLVVVLLGLFYFSVRATLISVIAIPISLTAAALVLNLREATLNIIILAGFAVALGVIVDDAIVGVENVVRRLRRHRQEGGEQSTASVILEATLEPRGPAIYAALILLLVALPLFFFIDFEILGNQAGAFFQSLAFSYVLALLASTAVALIVTPALTMLFLAKAPLERHESPIARQLRHGYDGLLARIVGRSRWAEAAVAVLLVAGLAMIPLVDSASGHAMIPPFQERDLLIRWEGAPGTSLPEMDRITAGVSDELRTIPGVRNVGAHVGRAVTSDQIVEINAGELWISIDPDADYDETVAAINEVVNGYPGLNRDVLTYSEEQLQEAGAGENLYVRIYGQDPATLQAKAEEVQQAMAGVDGVTDARVAVEAAQPQIQIQVDLAAAQQYGLKPGDVRRAAAVLVNGVEVGQLFEEQKVFEVIVVGVPELRHSLTNIQNLMIETPAGELVRLGDLATVSMSAAPTVIRHDAVSRYLDVTASVSGRDLGVVADDIEAALGGISFPLDYHAEVLGEYEERQAAMQNLLAFVLAAAVGIFLLLQAAFASWRLALLAFLALPTALVGGVLAAWIGGTATLGTLVGLLAILGIAVRNGVMLIGHCQHLEEEEAEAFGRELVVRGARERLAPVLMTALATALLLLPLVVPGAVPGFEVLRPMAIVVLGGLVTSTLLNLFVLPSLYLRFAPSARSQPAPAPAALSPALSPAGD